MKPRRPRRPPSILAARYHAAAIREMAVTVPRWWELPAVERRERVMRLAESMAASDGGGR